MPERRQELTTEGGLDVLSQEARMKDACARLATAGVNVLLFIDADTRQIEAAKRCGAPAIEIHTGHYADALTAAAQAVEYQKIVKAVKLGHELGMQVNAGHGLNYQNVQSIAAISHVRELNIGHAIIAEAAFVGMDEAVRKMKQLILAARK